MIFLRVTILKSVDFKEKLLFLKRNWCCLGDIYEFWHFIFHNEYFIELGIQVLFNDKSWFVS